MGMILEIYKKLKMVSMGEDISNFGNLIEYEINFSPICGKS